MDEETARLAVIARDFLRDISWDDFEENWESFVESWQVESVPKNVLKELKKYSLLKGLKKLKKEI